MALTVDWLDADLIAKLTPEQQAARERYQAWAEEHSAELDAYYEELRKHEADVERIEREVVVGQRITGFDERGNVMLENGVSFTYTDWRGLEVYGVDLPPRPVGPQYPGDRPGTIDMSARIALLGEGPAPLTEMLSKMRGGR